MKIEKDIFLAQHTTFNIGGDADFFCRVTNVTELREALVFSKKEKMPFFILGGGSNILVSDQGFPGLVIQMAIKGASCEKTHDGVLVVAWAGEDWDELVSKTVEWNVWGIENLSAIPGTVGASPVQNIGAYGVEVMDCIDSVTTINADTGEEKIFSNKECEFTYRNSIFKRPDCKKYVIVAVTFKLSSKPKQNISYKDLKQYFEAKNNINPSQGEIREAVIEIRSKKFPDLSEVGTAGSFWKNPIISQDEYGSLLKKYPLMPAFPFKEKVKVPLAWILDNVCNLKGHSLGDVGLYKNQPLVVIAKKGSSAEAVNNLAHQIKENVRQKTGIEIEREVEWVG